MPEKKAESIMVMMMYAISSQFIVQSSKWSTGSWSSCLALWGGIIAVNVPVPIPVVVSVFKVFASEGALGVADVIVAHVLVVTEKSSLEFALRGYKMRVEIGVEFVAILVPVEFFAGEYHAIDSLDTHVAPQVP
jgi:hypothetical protein